MYIERCCGPFTITRPASHASFATVRRLIRRDTFKYLSSLIPSCPLIKHELIAAMAEQSGLSKKDAEKALKAFTDVVAEQLKKEDKIQFFCSNAF